MFNTSGVPAGTFIEDVGTGIILSMGVNSAQSGSRTTSVVGGLFRMDTRSTQQEFTVIGVPTGGSTESQRLGVNLQNGNTILAPVAGNVGIGISAYATMGSKLQVNGNAAIGYSASTAAASNGLAVAGNVGVGIAAPTFQMHLRTSQVTGFTGFSSYDKLVIENGNSGEGANIQLVSNATNGVSEIGFSDATRNQGLLSYNHAADIMNFGVNGNTRFSINSSGILFAGNGETAASPSTGIISGTGGSGTNIAGAEFRIRGGASTGNAAGGPITFYTSAAGSSGTGVNAATERMRLDTRGNLGLGLTASTWGTNFRALQLNGVSLYSVLDNISNNGIVSNAYWDVTDNRWEYVGTGNATNYQHFNGQHIWYYAASGLANNAITFTTAMTLNASGNLGIGTGTIGSTLQVNGNAAIGYSASTAAPTNGLAVAGQSTFADNISITRNQNAATRLSINNSNNNALAYSEIIINTTTTASLGKFSPSTTAVKIISGSDYYLYNEAGGDIAILNNFATGNIKFAAGGSSTAHMTITSGGSIGIATTTIGSRLQVNGGAAIGYSASTAAPTNGLIVAGNAYFGGQIASLTDVMQLKGTGNVLIAMQSTVNTQFSGMNLYNEAGTLAASFALGNSNTGSFSNNFFLGPRTASGNLLFVTGASGTTRMTMTTNGELQFTPATNTSVLSTTGAYSLTGANAQSLIDLAGTWNTTGNPTAIKLNITNTASGATAKLIDLQVGGTSEFVVDKAGYTGINTGSPNSFLHVAGSVRFPITTKTATYTLDASDYTVVFDLNGNATANLPDATTIPGRIYVIKINRTNVGDTLTIDPNGAQTIDGNATIAIQCQYAVTIQSDGTNWRIIGDYAQGLNCL
jgi:hypothetical protein